MPTIVTFTMSEIISVVGKMNHREFSDMEEFISEFRRLLVLYAHQHGKTHTEADEEPSLFV